ncbi:MAG TPA: FAD-dependent oxidoreductase, partial [Micromonosporaceae bacterium]
MAGLLPGRSEGGAHPALAEAEPVPYWLDQPGAPEPAGPLTRGDRANLVVIGAGFSGLWTALLAKERAPEDDVVLLEARTAGWAASGRNGGFCSASLTHGLANGLVRFPDELSTLERLGRRNLVEIESAVARYSIGCDFERTGELSVAVEPWQMDDLHEYQAQASALGQTVDVLDRDAVRAELDSPTYLGGVWDRDGCAMLDPARLVWGLRSACLALGVRIHDGTPVRRIEQTGQRLRLHTPAGTVDADRVALATGAHTTLLRRLRHYLVPVYDYALMTEPLSPS